VVTDPRGSSMRLLILLGVLIAVGLMAFSLAMSGLGVVGNFFVFAAASVGLLVLTVNLASVRRRGPAQAPEQAGGPPTIRGA